MRIDKYHSSSRERASHHGAMIFNITENERLVAEQIFNARRGQASYCFSLDEYYFCDGVSHCVLELMKLSQQFSSILSKKLLREQLGALWSILAIGQAIPRYTGQDLQQVSIESAQTAFKERITLEQKIWLNTQMHERRRRYVSGSWDNYCSLNEFELLGIE